jgi:hypothetical protein
MRIAFKGTVVYEDNLPRKKKPLEFVEMLKLLNGKGKFKFKILRKTNEVKFLIKRIK